MQKKAMELIKGTLDVLILKTLSQGSMHGYGVSRWLRENSDDAFHVEEGALYPALRRLEKKGLLDSEWGLTETGREAKFYELTREGTRALELQLRDWGRYVEAMAKILYAAESGGT